MRVRAAEPGDIPAIVRLRARTFRETSQPSPPAAEAYMRRILFENPWREGALPSLVAEDEQGALCGFVGVLTRPMAIDGKTIRMAIPTQLMADPEKGALAGLLLLREVMGGGQEFTFSDAANDAARNIWERLGGLTAHFYSTVWTLPVRPLRAAAIGWGASAPARVARLLARPLTSLGDAVRGGPGVADLEIAPLDAAVAPRVAEVVPRRGLAPLYDPASFAWLVDRVRERAGGAEVLARTVGAGRKLAGWYVQVVGPTHANLLQLAALPGKYADVLRAARADARNAGAVFLSHRYEPGAVDAWVASGARLERRGPWVLVHARDPRVERAVLAGHAFLSRLEGEAWLSF